MVLLEMLVSRHMDADLQSLAPRSLQNGLKAGLWQKLSQLKILTLLKSWLFPQSKSTAQFSRKIASKPQSQTIDQNMHQLELTDSAVAKIADLVAEEGNPNLKLRTFVQGGGCSGFQYGFTFDEIANDDDFVIQKGTVTLLVDSVSMQYLMGATINYKEDLTGNSFVISNPNATTTCGCGSSFSI